MCVEVVFLVGRAGQLGCELCMCNLRGELVVSEGGVGRRERGDGRKCGLEDSVDFLQ